MNAIRWAALAAVAMVAAGCGFERQLNYVPHRSRIMRADLSYSVYTPPGWTPEESLPMVLFLHGGGDDPAAWDRHGITDRINAAYAAGDFPRAVVFFPQGDNGFWMNWHDGTRRYEDWVLDELLPEVAQRYNTQACPENCHIMGVSMGAHGALRFVLHRPEMFASVSALSGPIFNAEEMIDFTQSRLYGLFIPTHRIFGPATPRSRVDREDFYQRWRSQADIPMPIYIAWADKDREGLPELNRRFAQHLEDAGIDHIAEEFDGRHKWVSWGPIIERAFRYQLAGERPN